MASLEVILSDAVDRLDGPAALALWGFQRPGRCLQAGDAANTTGTDICAASCSASERADPRAHPAGWILAAAAAAPAGCRRARQHKVSISGALSGWRCPDHTRRLPRPAGRSMRDRRSQRAGCAEASPVAGALPSWGGGKTTDGLSTSLNGLQPAPASASQV